MTIYWAFVFTLMGAVFGSFFNVLSDRLPAQKSILKPPSHCPQCETRLKIPDLIPVVSYIFLRGRCRYCGSPIPKRVLLVELSSAGMFLGLYLIFGLSPELAIALFYFSVLLVILVIDLEHQLVFPVIVYTVAVIVSVINALTPEMAFTPGFLNSLAGGVAGLVLFFLIYYLSGKKGIGEGDISLSGLMGFMLGFPSVFVGIFLAVVTGGIVAVALLMLKLKNRKQAIPFGPFLSLGTMAALLWGQNILDWYLGFFGL
ncbi:MAG: prepilin peptidase [Petrimonas sp.]|jgi:leader peptidase (prepilin peptidase)/N-methyltransferase|nr:prepilin peptidase [Petrimonas sp.]